MIKELDEHMENIQLDLLFIGEEDIDVVESKEMLKKSFMEVSTVFGKILSSVAFATVRMFSVGAL